MASWPHPSISTIELDVLCRGVYINHRAESSADQPRWILVIGALGICFGLAMYGYKLIRVSVNLGSSLHGTTWIGC